MVKYVKPNTYVFVNKVISTIHLIKYFTLFETDNCFGFYDRLEGNEKAELARTVVYWSGLVGVTL